MTTIKTNRLVIRNYLESDVHDYIDCFKNPRVNCFSSEKVSNMNEAMINLKERIEDKGYLAICLTEENKVIGEVFYKKKEPDTYGIGWILNEKYGGSGYAFEGAEAVLEYLFTEKSARRIFAYAEDDNLSSRKLCKKLGMREEGLFIEFISFVKNEDGTPKYENTYQYAILKKEWQSREK